MGATRDRAPSIKPLQLYPISGAVNHEPASPTFSTYSTPVAAQSFQSHRRSMSSTDTLRKNNNNRLSLNFTFQPPASGLSPRKTPSPTRMPAADAIPEGAALRTGPSETPFLTALAAQERRVLELKEELHRAEADLQKLKKQWATHEALKKRDDAKRVQRLQPLNTALPPAGDRGSEDVSGSNAWLHREMERRKALINGTKTSNRTVIEGSRHVRALSLLSPDRTVYSPASTESPVDLHGVESKLKRPTYLPRTSSDPDRTDEVAGNADRDVELPGPQHEALLATGKQMAMEFKDGLWTFIEDLRQATVGDEAVHGTHSRAQSVLHAANEQRGATRQDGKTSIGFKPVKPVFPTRTSSKGTHHQSPTRRQSVLEAPEAAEALALIGVGESSWREDALQDGSPTEAPLVRRVSKKDSTPRRTKHRQTDSFDHWDTWDSPKSKVDSAQGSDNSSVLGGSVSEGTAGISPRTSTSLGRDRSHPQSPARLHNKRETIPWPALVKLSPGNLRRTASHLMNEWEKSLTPPPGAREGQDDYLGTESSKAKNAD
ncbi:hypothetical protein LTR66_006582 [Elasticomyces elasticus]|nr:hypothetical protein LTR66_006582 [Elasticomyces elasticus]